MTEPEDRSDKFERLRRQAEEMIRQQPEAAAEEPSADMLSLIHEIKIHQTELEIQNQELQRSQDEVARLHREYENLYEFAPCGYITLDAKGIVSRANLTAIKLLGVERRILLKSSFSRLLDKQGTDRFLAARKAAERTGEDEHIEIPLNKESNSLWIRVNIRADRDENGALKQWRMVLFDITERKQAEQALQESENRYHSLFESIRDAIVVADTERNIIDCNQAFTELFGYCLEEIRGSKTHSVYADYAEYRKMGEEIRNNIGSAKFVYTINYKKKSGEIFPGETNTFYLKNNKEEVTGFIGMIRDITERIESEKEKVQLEAWLRQSEKLESIGRLAGGLAHDLNNILSPILGYSELLLEETGEEDTRKESLEEIMKAGQRARDVVHQILAFGRKELLEFEDIDLNRLLEGFEKLLRRTIRENINIYMDLAPSLPYIRGDIGRLEQAVLNIAINAQDAMPMPNGGKLNIETARVEIEEGGTANREGIEQGTYVLLAISDTGTGMDADTLENLFEPFFTTKDTEHGTGLGLASAYGIIKQHGGDIRAYSEPGLGTTIQIYLPASSISVDHGSHDEQAQAPAHAPLDGTETILLVEDNKQVLNLASVVLKREGYQVLAAENGHCAIEILENHEGPIHLLLTDVIMPDMNGKELYKLVAISHPDIRVLYMSGYAYDVMTLQGTIGPDAHFIEKPFSINILSEKVRETLNHQ